MELEGWPNKKAEEDVFYWLADHQAKKHALQERYTDSLLDLLYLFGIRAPPERMIPDKDPMRPDFSEPSGVPDGVISVPPRLSPWSHENCVDYEWKGLFGDYRAAELVKQSPSESYAGIPSPADNAKSNWIQSIGNTLLDEPPRRVQRGLEEPFINDLEKLKSELYAEWLIVNPLVGPLARVQRGLEEPFINDLEMVKSKQFADWNFVFTPLDEPPRRVQPELKETYTTLFDNLPIFESWKDGLSTAFGRFINALEKVTTKQFTGWNIVSNGLILVCMFAIANAPAVGAARAMAPETAEPGSLQAGDFEKRSNFWFGVVNCIGVLAAIITLLKSFNWRRRPSIAGT